MEELRLRSASSGILPHLAGLTVCLSLAGVNAALERFSETLRST